MKERKINKRITYSYLDYKDGLLQSYIDIDLKIDDDTNELTELTQTELQNIVAQKWKKAGYKSGDINSVEQLYID